MTTSATTDNLVIGIDQTASTLMGDRNTTPPAPTSPALSLTFDNSATPASPVLTIDGVSPAPTQLSTQDRIKIDIDRAAEILIAKQNRLSLSFDSSSPIPQPVLSVASSVKSVIARSTRGPVPVHPVYTKLNKLHLDERFRRIFAEAQRSHSLSTGGKALVNSALAQTAVVLKRDGGNAVDFKVLFQSHVASIAKRDGLESQIPAALDLLAKSDKYGIQYKMGIVMPQSIIPKPLLISPGDILATYTHETTIPEYIRWLDVSEPHTIPIPQYIDTRISGHIRSLIEEANGKGQNTEIFVGPEEEMRTFYDKMGYKPVAELLTRSSIKYFLLQNPRDPEDTKVVIWGVGNHSKLNHTLLQLKYSGVDLDKVRIRGNIDAAERLNALFLRSELQKIGLPISLAFLGNRSQMLIELALRLYPKEMKNVLAPELEDAAERILTERNRLHTFEIGGVYKFSAVEVEIHGKKQALVAFRMPNGSLSRYAAQALMDNKVENFVMVGAGGSLTTDAPVGSYQPLIASYYNASSVELRSDDLQPMPLRLPHDFPMSPRTANLTVDSPLVETERWLEEAHSSRRGSVDVESFFVLDEYARAATKPKSLLGIFTSDEVGRHPLSDKIDTKVAWRALPQLIHSCFDAIHVPVEVVTAQ